MQNTGAGLKKYHFSKFCDAVIIPTENGVVQNNRPATDHRPPTTDHILIKTLTTDHSQK